MIKVQDMNFSYQDFHVLKNVNFLEAEPIIIGLWGRNGAGKTTLMKLLSGQEKPYSGVLEMDGIIPYGNSESMRHIVYMQENHPFSEIWSVKDMMRFGRYLYPNWDQKFAEELVELFDLPRKKKIVTFSKGMQTMAKIIMGLASHSTITIFDEPTNGLDAHMRKSFYDVLLETYEENPRLFLLSTHHIDEIEPLCEKLAIVDQHTISKYESMEEIKLQGVQLVGKAEDVEVIAEGYTIIERKKIGHQLSVMLDTTFTEKIRDSAIDRKVKITKAPLQDYLVNITSGGDRR